MRVLGQMRRIVGKSILAAIVMAAPLFCAAPAHAGGAGNCGGSVLGLAGTETCGAYKNDASDVTNPNDLHGFTVSTGGDLVLAPCTPTRPPLVILIQAECTTGLRQRP